MFVEMKFKYQKKQKKNDRSKTKDDNISINN